MPCYCAQPLCPGTEPDAVRCPADVRRTRSTDCGVRPFSTLRSAATAAPLGDSRPAAAPPPRRQSLSSVGKELPGRSLPGNAIHHLDASRETSVDSLLSADRQETPARCSSSPCLLLLKLICTVSRLHPNLQPCNVHVPDLLMAPSSWHHVLCLLPAACFVLVVVFGPSAIVLNRFYTPKRPSAGRPWAQVASACAA